MQIICIFDSFRQFFVPPYNRSASREERLGHVAHNLVANHPYQGLEGAVHFHIAVTDEQTALEVARGRGQGQLRRLACLGQQAVGFGGDFASEGGAVCLGKDQLFLAGDRGADGQIGSKSSYSPSGSWVSFS